MSENFSIKEVIMMIQEEKEARLELTKELELTRQYIQRYNGLREEINIHAGQIKDLQDARISLEQKAEGRYSVGQAIRDWGGWIFGLIATGVLIAQFF